MRRTSKLLISGSLLCLSLLKAFLPSAEATRVPKMNMKELITKTGLIFIGTVVNLDRCSQEESPCTRVVFGNLEIINGKAPDKELAFLLPEGMLKDGSYLRVVGAPTFSKGERYLVFVRSGDWHITPVTNWFHSSFREITIQGLPNVTFFVNYDGRAVKDITESGFVLGQVIAPPQSYLNSAKRDALHGTARGAVSESPAINSKIEELSKMQGAKPGEIDVSSIGLTKDKFVQLIREWVQRVRGEMVVAPEAVIKLKPASAIKTTGQVAAKKFETPREEEFEGERTIEKEKPGKQPSAGTENSESKVKDQADKKPSSGTEDESPR